MSALKYIPGFFVIAMTFYMFFVMETMFVYTDSESMLPAVKPGDHMVSIAMKSDYPPRGSVVNFNFYENGRIRYIKRVVGLPGDLVEVREGRLYLNGELQNEPYLKDEAINYDLTPLVVPEGHVFVLGDNRNNSYDSADWGVLPVRDILGELVLVYWPDPRFLN